MAKKEYKTPEDYLDSLSKTWKKAWPTMVSDATLKLIPTGVGYGLSLVASPVGGEIGGIITKRLLEFMLKKFTHIYEHGELNLTEVFGRKIPDIRYQSVGEFWTKVISDKLEENCLVEILGLLSPYGPLTPGHPLSRPGYTVEGWEAIGELETEDTEEYDTRDGFIYGDRVIRLSIPRDHKYYAGLYDAYYGISNVSIPLYVNESIFRSKKPEIKNLKELWNDPTIGGKILKVKGRLRTMPNFYSQFSLQLPPNYCNLPSYGLEVFDVEVSPTLSGVTHMAVSVGWDKQSEERLLTHYFNIQNKAQFKIAEEYLEKGRTKHNKSLIFNYDDLACFKSSWGHKIPLYNDMLRPWLEGEQMN